MRYLLMASLLFLVIALPAAGAHSAEAVRNDTSRAAQSVQQVYRGNANSKKYHNASCRYYTCKNCTVRLGSREDARARGFTACKLCGG